jgi:hypothetical protein
MKLLNSKTNSLKSKTLGLAMAAVLIPGGLAMAGDGHHARRNVSGSVEVVHQIPGGVVTVGAEWGKRRNDPPPVVIVQQPQPQPQPQVIVVERERPRHRDREVTIIRNEPACEKVVVIEKHGNRGRHYGRHNGHGRGHDFNRGDRGHRGDSHYYNDGKQVSYDRKGPDGQYHYYKDANQVSETRVDGSGTYHYYEDANQVSINDNRAGRERNVYVRK